LIIAGSFGFLVWRDLLLYRKKHRLSLHTSLALSTGAIILILSLMSYLLTEDNLAAQFPHMSVEHRFINTIFMAITPRTAGLTTFSYRNLSPAG
ncbi:Trk family potassium uptake protein, partial [Limosilactobacillus mucosae]|nr:Trk family potassium uptake protein [Limosilactobacillus mucosae]